MAKVKSEMTPLMQQYWQVKNAHPDKIILFRMGDFFEMFHDDAVKSAPILNIALTQRNKKSSDYTPMCGVPHHSVADKINRLLSAGLKIAICDQVEDPKLAKGLVKRAVTRILSPGMVYDPETLDYRTPVYIASYIGKNLSLLDGSTGEWIQFNDVSSKRLLDLSQVLCPVEWVYGIEEQKQKLEDILGHSTSSFSSPLLLSQISNLASSSENLLKELFNKQKCTPSESSQLVVQYAVELQGLDLLKTIQPLSLRDIGEKMTLSSSVLRHLEIFETYKGSLEGSLIKAIDWTVTPGGARKLKNYLSFPLLSAEAMRQRQSLIHRWTRFPDHLKAIRETLKGLGDLNRRLGKIASPSCSPYDLWSLARSIEQGLMAELVVSNISGMTLDSETNALTLATQLVHEIKSFYKEDAPLNYRGGGFTQKGYNEELDELILLSEDSQSAVYEIEERERQQTGISSLKIRYNQVFGYSIEVTHLHKSKVPEYRYMRKQTLTQAERYTTDELIELEKRILSARTKRVDLELYLFEQLKQKTLILSREILQLSERWTDFDVTSSFAALVFERGYVFPEIYEGPLVVKAGRHPVVEVLSSHSYVVNDVKLESGHTLLLTGPNMAGKSTYMRMVALLVLMAQAGLPVPADEMKFRPYDKLFTRIGASDFIAEGLSTFMVEMKEAAEMLSECSENSLIIMDEIGRGTATFDGMSLAQALLEHIVSSRRTTMLFATHYHELTELEQTDERIHNAHMSVQENKGELRFLYSIKAGPARVSYGVQVARLAGLPQSVVKRAEQILKGKEKQEDDRNRFQLSLFSMADTDEDSVDHGQMAEPKEEILGKLMSLDVNALSPLQALTQLHQLQVELSSSKEAVKLSTEV